MCITDIVFALVDGLAWMHYFRNISHNDNENEMRVTQIFTCEETGWDNNNEDEWGDLECLYKSSKQEWKLDGGLFSDTVKQ